MAKKKKTSKVKNQAVNLNHTIPLLAIIFICVAVFFFFLAQLLQGNTLSIEEENSTDIIVNPQDMMPSQSRMSTLYFRYAETGYLAKQVREVVTRSDESLEEAVIRELIAGPDAETAQLSTLLPEGTVIKKIEAHKEIIYITFNRELLRKDRVDVNVQENNRRLMLMTKSIVNTVLDLGTYSSVQILIDEQGDGIGTELSAKQFGFGGDTEIAEQPLALLVYDYDVILSPEVIQENIVSAINNQDWAALYQLVEPYDLQGNQRPSFSEAREKWIELSTSINRSDLVGITQGPNDTYVILRLMVQGKITEKEFFYQSFPMVLVPQDSVWHIPYDVLLRFMGESKS